MNLSHPNELLKLAIKEGCKTVSDFAAYIKVQNEANRQLSL